MAHAEGPFLIQDAEDGPGLLTQADDGKLFMWSQPDGRVIMVAPPSGGSQIIGHFGGYSIQQATDGPGALTIASDGKALTWNQASGHFVMATLNAADADTLDGHDSTYFLPAASYTAADVLAKLLTVDGSGSTLDADTLDGHDTGYFEAAGVAATALAAHVAAADPHVGYLLATGARTGATGQAQAFTLGLGVPSGGAVGIGTLTPAYPFQMLTAETPATTIAARIGNVGGVELITATNDRTFAGAGNWTGTNWAVSAGTLLHTAGSTADAVLANANLTAASIISGRRYLVVFTVAGMTTGTLIAKLGTAVSTTVTASGTYTMSILAAADNANLIFTPSSPFDGSVDNVSVTRIQNDFVILNNGKVGIGTIAPSEPLDMVINSNAVNRISLLNSNAGTGARAGLILSSDTAQGLFDMYSSGNTQGLGITGVTTPNLIWFRAITTNMFLLGTSNAGSVAFCTNAVMRMYISSAGLISIGANITPTAFLDLPAGVVGNAQQRFRLGVAPTTPNDGDLWHDGALTFYATDATTAAIVDTLRLRRASSGTPAAGFGVGFSARLASSTTANQDAGRLTFEWITATHASRAAKGQLTSFYTTTEKPSVTWGSNSTVALLSFYDVVTPIARQVLATGAGATVDNIITALQALGLVKQS